MRKVSLLVSAVALASLPATANAALYQFDLTGSRSASFRLESTQPDAFSSLQTQFFDVPGTYAGSAGTAASVSFGAVFFINALDIANTPLGFTQFGGAPLFTGPTSSPVFTPGTYSLFGFVSGRSTLEITAVPEPATWALMIAGFGLVGTALRRRTALAA